MLDPELKKKIKAEKQINELLVELQRISIKISEAPLEDLDKKIFTEFLERAYYSRDVLREELAKYHQKY
ncbi:MAG: hypothetical protein ACFFDB_20705 [Promethearchaeota archaeon]